MNKIKQLFTFNKAVNQYNTIAQEVDAMPTKSLLLSKTFWANIAGLALTLSGVLPQKWGVPVMAAANIILRLISNQAITISIPWKS